MAKFRKRPVVVEAWQFDGTEEQAARRGVHYSGRDDLGRPSFSIVTLEGRMRVSPGDWIVTGVQGEKYPCKPDIFAATYEPAEET